VYLAANGAVVVIGMMVRQRLAEIVMLRRNLVFLLVLHLMQRLGQRGGEGGHTQEKENGNNSPHAPQYDTGNAKMQLNCIEAAADRRRDPLPT
jgi:hypothetical protein